MSSSSPIYSQGFNFSDFLQKGVDPRTGQYTCMVDLYEAPIQARNCPPFKLSLSFHPLNTQDVGLGQGWTFNLPSYEHRQSNRVVSLSTGESYRVTETSSAIFTTDQKLKSSTLKKLDANTYQITYKSGQIENLSSFNDRYNKSVLVDLYASTGRSLSFVWSALGETARLDKIQQGSEILLEVKYGASQVDITKAPNTPEAATFTLIQRNSQLVEIRLPWDGASWKFGYQKFGQMVYLNNVTSPSGLVEEISYKEQGHRLPTGAPYQAIPYAISHTARPGNSQPPITTSYTYSDYNFLAYGSSQNWKNGEDNLFLTRDEYQYTSTVQIQGGIRTKNTYNKFHLLVSSEQQKGIKQVTQKMTYHAVPFASFENQPAQYQLPKTVETIYKDTASQATRTETSHNVFDEWGNPTQDIKPNGIRIDRIYYPAAGEGAYCPRDPHDFQRYLKRETVTPANSAGPIRSENYTYTQMPTATGAKTSYLVVLQQKQNMEGNQLLTKFDYTYVNNAAARDHTRLQRQVTRLFDQYPTAQNWTYTYPNNSKFVQTVATTAFDASTAVEETGYSLWSGLTVTHKSQSGISTHYYYDSLGRSSKIVHSQGTSYESVERQEYLFLGIDNGSRTTVFDAKNVQTRYIADGLERLWRVEKQDDQVFRVIQENSYNAQDQLITASDIDWLRTDRIDLPTEQRSTKSMEYDDWGKVYRVSENSGLRVLTNTDPITNTKVEGVEGEGMTKTMLNLFGAPTQIALYHKNNTLYSKMDYTYDGLNRLLRQQDNLGRATAYKPDSFDRVVETIWPNTRVVKTQYASQTTALLPISVTLNDRTVGEQSFDGLGRVTRKVMGTRTTSQSYQGISPEPSQIINAKGEQYNLTYQSALNGALTQISSSSHTDAYKYDAQTAAPLQFKGAYSTHDLQYLTSGLLSRETISINGGQTFSSLYTYSMAGKLQKYIDANGKLQETQYDAFGRPQQVAQGRLKVSFVYDSASRVIENRVQDEEKNTKITTKLTYDDFGREIKRSVYNGETTLIYHLSQTYNGIGLLASRIQEKSGSVMRSESFEYDVHNRLVNYQCQGTEPPADQQGNPLRSQQFVFDNYDNIVQCSTVFQDGSSNTSLSSFGTQDPTQLVQITNTHPSYSSQMVLEYDYNGCLTRDEQGRRLQYDNMSRLTDVRDANNNILAQYLYDAAGNLACQRVPNQPDTRFFYRGSLIAVQKGDRSVSYLSNGSEYWAETISQQGGSTETHLWASNCQQSILTKLDSQNPNQIQNQQYTPYGCSGSETGSSFSSIGFNGQWRDPITGWYHPGNGYRVYNPQLQRFHTPDPWAPFASGEINPYVYCLGDPINRVDPTGHFSLFGINLTWKDLIMVVVGIAVSVGVGILTGGASLAIQVGVGLAAGVLSDVASGMVGSLAIGEKITWRSVGLDALGGLLGGLGGEAGGRFLKQGFKATKALPTALKKTVGRAGSYAVTKEAAGAVASKSITVLKSGLRASARGLIPGQATSRSLVPLIAPDPQDKTEQSQGGSSKLVSNNGTDDFSTAPLGRSGPAQVGSQSFYLDRGSSMTRDIIRPLMRDGDDIAMSTSLMSNYGNVSSAGQSAVASLLGREIRFTYGPLTNLQSEEDS
ncbi:putative rhs repeat protein [Botrytis fragariae]|uniref:Putative rhs repeat protein n=1 Tax=Botrytis fragariae TaxID=1964551 RepID=A0A8H6EK72_9HELO|nr:putative rhs repeat protein [Botrytis fragariae]KAF5875234.1 putative rhs repeat protein [Botrytis fragariae]